MVIFIEWLGEKGDLVTLEDEAVSRSDIFVELADRIADRLEEFGCVKLATGHESEIAFTKHVDETIGLVEKVGLGSG